MRDYLADAQKWMGVPLPLRRLLADDYALTLAAIVSRLTVEDIYARKYAAYCLGQIGDARVLEKLQEALDSEPADGVRHAMAAALATIKKLPASSGSTEEQRCEYMQKVYEKGMPDEIRQQMQAATRETKPKGVSSTTAKATSGCVVTLGVFVLIGIVASFLFAR